MRRPLLLTGAAVLAAALSACTEPPAPPSTPPAPRPAPALELVAYDSCDTLLTDLRKAAKANVQPWGFGNPRWIDFMGGAADGANFRAAPGAAGAEKQAPAYSGTNTHELGVDEPDLVKTDGKRIVTVVRQKLTVIDAAQHRVAGSLSLPGTVDQVLLTGDHALVMGTQWGRVQNGIVDGPTSRVDPSFVQTSVWLVDVSAPRILSTYTVDAAYADARMTGAVARIVVHSTPKISFPMDVRGGEKALVKANQKIIDKAPLSAWLPAYTADGEKGQLDCGDVARPHSYSGTSLVTVLSFDLSRDTLRAGVPTAVLADGETVYGSGTSLYIAHDERWRGLDTKAGTEIYQFDISAMQPRYVAGGSVPGWLLSQYSLSEYDGVLRVATTSGHPWAQGAKSTSSVYALRDTGGLLKVVGKVGGLGTGEQIYAVRFLGPVGYVVTFRRTDPLYTIDLSDPAHPRVAGELKIPGYSAYLHPMGRDRLIGVGQNADSDGRVQGTQVSLFDVSDLRNPGRVANLELGEHAFSEAEHDPHAFLYWPDRKLLVVPVQQWWAKTGDAKDVRIGVSLVRVEEGGLADAGWISHPPVAGMGQTPVPIRRSLVIGDELWTISEAGVMASSLGTAQKIAWLPL